MFNGYVTFVTSILMIGVVTAVIGDVAAQLGCFIYLKDSVNAIAFVALGTSVPGGFPNAEARPRDRAVKQCDCSLLLWPVFTA
jgi:solute carrier family 8 (sodium/calcium exchanger)